MLKFNDRDHFQNALVANKQRLFVTNKQHLYTLLGIAAIPFIPIECGSFRDIQLRSARFLENSVGDGKISTNLNILALAGWGFG